MINNRTYELNLNIKENRLEDSYYKRNFINSQIIKAFKDFQEDAKVYYARFFYYIIKNGYKYIHKESYFQNITLYDTWGNEDRVKEYCNIKDKVNIPRYLDYQERIFNYIRGNYGFLVQVQEDKKFFKAKILPGNLIHQLISKKEFQELNIHYHKAIELNVNPFSSLLSKNMIRTISGIKLVDFKQVRVTDFEMDLPFLVFLANKEETYFNLFTSKENKDYDFTKFLESHEVEKEKIKYVYF